MKGYRTIAFNVLMAVIAVIAALNPEAEVPDAAQVGDGMDAVFAAIAAVTAIGNVTLRAVTNTPIGKKESPDA